MAIMKQVDKLSNCIEDKIDSQILELKNMILENYKETTADKMEIDLFMKLQDIGKISMQGYMEKKF
jgi:hypothetical protein